MTVPAPLPICEQCGKPLAPNSFLSGCLNCQLFAALDENGAAGQSNGERIYQHYEILTKGDGSLWELGRGAMGITYKAQDVTLRIPVALKVIHVRFSSHALVRARFLQEARTAAQLRHPNVAGVYHFGTITTPADSNEIPINEGDCFYAMEFVEGETLEARLRRASPLSAKLVIAIGEQVSLALAAAQKKGLVHCDLKPSNIVLVRDSNPNGSGEALLKVIDFGVARAVSEAVEQAELGVSTSPTQTSFGGTPAFASPEQLTGKLLDVRSDIFSLGATLWLCLTGELPFPGHTPESILRLHLSGELPLQQLDAVSCPLELRTLLIAMLSVDGMLRPVSATELTRRFVECAGLSKNEASDRVLAQDREALQFFRSAQDVAHGSSPTKQRYEDAIRLLEKAVSSAPDFAQAHAMLAEMHALMYRNSHDRSPARAESVRLSAETALRLSPANGEGHRARGIYYYHIRNDYSQARLDFIEALRALPDDADSLLGLGWIDSRENRWDAALSSFQKAAELHPYRLEYVNPWWRTLVAVRRYPEARRVLDQLIERHPENLRIRLNRAYMAFDELADLQPLQAFLDSVPPDYDPDGVITFQSWGLARYRDDLEAAERILARSPLPTFAGHVDGQIYPRATLELLIVLQRGDSETGGKMAGAQLPFLREMVRRMPDVPGPLMLLAACQAISLELGDAVEMGQRALAQLPPEKDGIDGPKLALQMLWIYIFAKQFDAAFDLLERYAPWPGFLSYGELSWGVTYRPLRSDPRFFKILESLKPTAR